nr:hypothetical protein [Tanacetum cinerariifolium]
MVFIHEVESSNPRLSCAVVDWWSGDGSQWPTTVDRHLPPLTVVATIDRWSGGGSVDDAETVIMPRDTTQVVTRGHLMIGMQVAGSGTRLHVWVRGGRTHGAMRLEDQRINALAVRGFQQMITWRVQKDENTPGSWAVNATALKRRIYPPTLRLYI